MQQFSLVGQTVRLSPQNKKEGGNDTRSLFISSEFMDDGTRKYMVQDLETKQEFAACKTRYDQLFLVKKTKMRLKAPKGEGIYSTRSLDFTLKKS